jgi:hypothetical protein
MEFYYEVLENKIQIIRLTSSKVVSAIFGPWAEGVDLDDASLSRA